MNFKKLKPATRNALRTLHAARVGPKAGAVTPSAKSAAARSTTRPTARPTARTSRFSRTSRPR